MKKVMLLVFILSLGLLLGSCDSLFESEEKVYTVTFHSMGGSVLDPIEVFEDTLFFPSQIPIKIDYQFDGWYLDEDLIYPMSFLHGVNQHINLYAKWEKTSLTELEIRAIIQDILLSDDLVVADQEMINQIVFDLIESEDLIDESKIIAALLAQLDIVTLYENHITAMLALAKQSVVMIDTYTGSQIDGGGSGVIYKKVGNTYYVLTNEHVVANYQSGQFRITLLTPQGEVVIPRSLVNLRGKSVLHDLAVLTFSSTLSFPLLPFAEKEDLKVGQTVYAIGSPLDLPHSVSIGIISAINRPMTDDYGMDTIMVQHTAAINPGNSGGALINVYGKLIGVNDMSYVDEYVGEGINGLNFAIQIDIVKSILPTLEN